MDSITKHEELLKSITTLTGKNVFGKPFTLSDLYSAFLEIYSGNLCRSIIEKVRNIPNPNARQEYKLRNLPFFTIGEFRDNERKNKSLISTQFAIFDYDHLGETLEQQWNCILNDNRVFAAFHSPSGDGIKMICKFDQPITDPAKYSTLYKHYASEFNIDLGTEADKTSDCSRPCYISYDPNLFLNPDAFTLSTEVDSQDSNGLSVSQKKFSKEEFLSQLKGVKAGQSRTPGLTEAIGIMMKNGFDREFAIAYALGWNQLNEIPHTEEKVVYTVNDLYDRYANQSISEKTKDFFSYEAGVFEARIVGDEFSIKNIGEKKYYVKMNVQDKEEKARYYAHIVKNNDLHTLRRIDYVSDFSATESFYTFNCKEGVFVAHIAPVPAKLKDNEYIETYLEYIFGTYKQFIKEWLAVYCFTNYKKLPHLILTGVRGSSKSTFVEMISGIFPSLSSWTKELEGNFNPDAEKKLVVIDESDSKGKIQYRTLKKYAGQSSVQINKKYLPQYQVRNNVNLIIMSNDDEAIYVEREEVPVDESNNQFFVYKFHGFVGAIVPDFSEKLVDRIGHYARTELKSVFDSLSFDGNRYSIRVPITEEEKYLFQNSISEVESEADGLINKIMLNVSDPNFIWAKFVRSGYLPTEYLSNIFNRIPKHKIVADLQRRGYLRKDKVDRYYQADGKRPYCYKIADKWMEEIKAEVQGCCCVTDEKDIFVN